MAKALAKKKSSKQSGGKMINSKRPEARAKKVEKADLKDVRGGWNRPCGKKHPFLARVWDGTHRNSRKADCGKTNRPAKASAYQGKR